MANANRHRRNHYWFQVVICRMYDVAVMNVRGLMKMVGINFRMVELKRLLAHGLASKTVRPTLIKRQMHSKAPPPRKAINKGQRLDGNLHLWDIADSRRRCVVHRKRCETNKKCKTCDVHLCNGAAWERYHTLNEYKI